MRKCALVGVFAMLFALVTPAPAQAIIHEIVASHCTAQHNHDKHVDPPGQLNEKGNSFARALQASKVYDLQFGVDQGGVEGLNFVTGDFGPLPSPGEGEAAISVFVDPTRPNAKLGDFMFWAYFPEETPEGTLHIYLQIYELQHPAFEQCENFHGE